MSSSSSSSSPHRLPFPTTTITDAGPAGLDPEAVADPAGLEPGAVAGLNGLEPGADVSGVDGTGSDIELADADSVGLEPGSGAGPAGLEPGAGAGLGGLEPGSAGPAGLEPGAGAGLGGLEPGSGAGSVGLELGADISGTDRTEGSAGLISSLLPPVLFSSLDPSSDEAEGLFPDKVTPAVSSSVPGCVWE